MATAFQQSQLYTGYDDNNSDEIQIINNGSEDISDSLGELSDELNSFHISQPTTYTTKGTTVDTNDNIKKQFKAYQANNSFSESAFVSGFRDADEHTNDETNNNDHSDEMISNSVILNNDNSFRGNSPTDSISDGNESNFMDYGTVQHRARQLTSRTTVGNTSAQFLPYMKQQLRDIDTRGNRGLNFSYNDGKEQIALSSEDLQNKYGNITDNRRSASTREPPSALIVKDMGELSGQVMNTFKRKNELQQSRVYHDVTTGSAYHNEGNEMEEDEEEYADSDVLEDDDDPALAAKQVYNNLLRTQGSRYFDMKRNITNRTVSTRGSSVSGTSYNKELNLITPGSIGYRFKHSKGIWVPEEEFQNISSSQVAETTTATNNTSKMNNSSTKNTTSTFTLSEETQDDTNDDIANSTTPLDPPRIDQETLLRNVFSKETSEDIIPTHVHETVEDTTRLSDIPEMSFSATRQQTVSLLMNALESALPQDSTNWENVHSLKMSNQKILRSVVALDRYMPNLIKLDLNNNEISNLEGFPITLKELNLSNNKVNDTFCTFSENNRLRKLDLSHNTLSHDLQILNSCHNLLSVNLSHNNITSLSQLGDSMIHHLDISFNSLVGIINFEKIIAQNDNRLGGWLTIQELDLSNNTEITELHHIEKLTSLRVLRVNNIPGLKILNTDNSMLTRLEIVCDNSITKISGKDETDYEGFSLTGFHNLQELVIDNNTRIIDDIPSSLHVATVKGILNSEIDSKNISAILNKIPGNILSLHIHNLPHINPLTLVEQDHFHELSELSLSGCGINSVYSLLSKLPSSKKLQYLDVSNTPLSNRRIMSIESPTDGTIEFQKQFHSLIQEACPALQELHI